MDYNVTVKYAKKKNLRNLKGKVIKNIVKNGFPFLKTKKKNISKVDSTNQITLKSN